MPLINNVVVTPLTTSATLEFDVSAPIADVKNTQVCALEVSPNRNLFSDLGSYTVTTDLDPTITMGADLSTRKCGGCRESFDLATQRSGRRQCLLRTSHV